jgi:hypothetical protein
MINLCKNLFLLFFGLLTTTALVEIVRNETYLISDGKSLTNLSSNNIIRARDERRKLFVSSSHSNISLTKSLQALNVPHSKISHPSISLESTISPNLFAQLVAGSSLSSGFNGDNGPATLALIDSVHMYVDTAGNTYFADNNYARVRKVDGSGIITTFAGAGTQSLSGVTAPISSVQFVAPQGITGDNSGNVYVSDFHFIWKISGGIASVYAQTTSAGTGFAGDGGSPLAAKMDGPCGLWLTPSNALYIADYNNNRIRKVVSNTISTVVGSGCSLCIGTYTGDNGPANVATIYHPKSVYLDTNGKMFIADFGNNCIRSVDTNSIITTFAGTGASSPFNGASPLTATLATLSQPFDVKEILLEIFISLISGMRLFESWIRVALFQPSLVILEALALLEEFRLERHRFLTLRVFG